MGVIGVVAFLAVVGVVWLLVLKGRPTLRRFGIIPLALALVLLDSQSRFTVPLGVFSLQSAYETEWQLVAAASFIGLVPMMAAFVFLQRYFISGLTAGAVKG